MTNSLYIMLLRCLDFTEPILNIFLWYSDQAMG